MNNNLRAAILGGVIGTTIMTTVMSATPLLGLVDIFPPVMLAELLEMPVIIGGMLHFVIGIVLAIIYTFLFAPSIKIENLFVKGAVFGLLVFVFAQIALGRMGAIVDVEGPKVLMGMISLFADVIFGMVVAKSIGDYIEVLNPAV